MVSLNDLEAQIAALGGQTSADLDGDSDDAEDAGEEKDESSSASSEETTDAAAKARAKARAAVAKAMAAEIEEGDDVISTKKACVGAGRQARKAERDDEEPQQSETNRAKREANEEIQQSERKRPKKGAAAAVCFRYLKNECKFDDCAFRHVDAKRLEQDEQAQILKELPLRKYDFRLAEVMRDLSIPQCRDHHKKEKCPRPEGKCHYWHLTNAAVARWAGFEFWCDICRKGCLTEQALLEHQQARPHREKLAAQGGGAVSLSRGRGSGRGSSYGDRSGRDSSSARGGRGVNESDDTACRRGGRSGRGIN